MASFKHKEKMYYYDDVIHIAQDLSPEYLRLTQDFHFGVYGGPHYKIPYNTTWNGASSPGTPLARFIAPKFYKNIRASGIHDFLCSIAKNDADRVNADLWYYLAKKYIEKDLDIINRVSWLGVRVGAFFGIGNSFKD